MAGRGEKRNRTVEERTNNLILKAPNANDWPQGVH
jgi:hypothetical protein